MSNREVLLALGSNVGNRLAMLEKALRALDKAGLSITDKSRVWETEPWGVTDPSVLCPLAFPHRSWCRSSARRDLILS